MGASHEVSRPQRYTFCPPASGSHYNAAGLGPIVPRVFGPDDSVGPPNWIHNLEHGGLVILYRGDSEGATADRPGAVRAVLRQLPAEPDLPARARSDLAGHRPVRLDEVAVRGARLGSRAAAARVGPEPGAGLLRDRVRAARRRRRLRRAAGAAVRGAVAEPGAELVGRARRQPVGRPEHESSTPPSAAPSPSAPPS